MIEDLEYNIKSIKSLFFFLKQNAPPQMIASKDMLSKKAT